MTARAGSRRARTGRRDAIDRIWLGAIGTSFVFWVAIMIERFGYGRFCGILFVGLMWQRVLGR